MKLDRDLQRTLLTTLSEHYPNAMKVGSLTDENPDVTANLYYMKEHGLIDADRDQDTSHRNFRFLQARATAAGMDFLADDGGLSAILGVVTFKLHDDTIRNLIATRIQDSDLPAEEKTGLLNQLRELRGESIKHLTMKLLDAGLDNASKALPLIQRALEVFQ